MQELHFGAGCHIAEAARMLVEAVKGGDAAFGHFNDIQLNAMPGATADSIVEFFKDETARRHEAYKRSPAGNAAEVEREQRRRDAQATHDSLMVKLLSLDFSNDVAVLDWICAMQGASDHVDVIARRKTIVSAFEKRGFVVGANCGKDYRPGDRDNMFRYLVGQALDGLKSGPAIHPIIHKFADEWRNQFCRACALASASSEGGK